MYTLFEPEIATPQLSNISIWFAAKELFCFYASFRSALCDNVIMADTQKSVVTKFFMDKQGKVIVGQRPNIPLVLWGASTVMSIVTNGRLKTGFHDISTATLFTWAYLEIKSGDSLFRRLLGVIVMLALLTKIFGVW